MNMFSTKDLVEGLHCLGVEKGDVLLVRAGLRSIGRLSSNDRQDYVNFLLEAVGDTGTVIGLAFTSRYKEGGSGQLAIFDGTNKSYAGALVNMMLQHPDAYRSTHPTNSYVAIGPCAEEILGDHDETSGAYEPVRKIMALNGKMVLIGCCGSSPGFTTTHLAEVDLGLNRRIMFRHRNKVYYKKDGKIHLFRRDDIGSCSSIFYRFYGHYIKNEVLQQGYIGNAYSLCIDAKKAYDIDVNVLKNNPRITICDNPDCGLCRARRWDNLHAKPYYHFRQYSKRVKRKLVGMSRGEAQ
jgi:aminoglycoside N3'-acetyltransferase